PLIPNSGKGGDEVSNMLSRRVIGVFLEERGEEYGFDLKEDEVVLKVKDVYLVDGVFDGALCEDEDEDFAIGEGTRKDYGTKRGRPSTSASLSSGFDHPSSSHHVEEDDDENAEVKTELTIELKNKPRNNLLTYCEKTVEPIHPKHGIETD
nr:hypothetical protein [Tanacetum cinerariifolium]